VQRGPATGLRWHRRLIARGWTHTTRLGNELIGAARPSMASIGFSDVSGSVDSSTITQCTTTLDGRSTGLLWDMWASAASERGQGGLERAGSIPRLVRKMEIVSTQRFKPRANRRDRTGQRLGVQWFSEEFQKDGGPDRRQLEPSVQLAEPRGAAPAALAAYRTRGCTSARPLSARITLVLGPVSPSSAHTLHDRDSSA
jgi:hypothetical protein